MKDGRASTSPAPMSSEDYRDRNGIGFIDVGGDQKALSVRRDVVGEQVKRGDRNAPVHLKRMILVRPSSAQKGAAFRAITLDDAAALG